MSKLTSGDTAPLFELLDQQGNLIKLADLKGRKVLLYFYPKASTPGCTKQACNVRDAYSELQSNDVVSIGISPDPVAKQKKFADKYELPFPLLADEDHAVADAYGVWDKKSMYGKIFFGIVRSAFLIDEDGKIAQTWYKVSPKDTVPNALNSL
jgi:peroxiredoxin Q/BCP